MNGPWPIHDVVVSAVRNAVSAATTIFATTSQIRSFFIVVNLVFFHECSLILGVATLKI